MHTRDAWFSYIFSNWALSWVLKWHGTVMPVGISINPHLPWCCLNNAKRRVRNLGRLFAPTSLCSCDEGSVSFIVLPVDVYKGTLGQGDDHIHITIVTGNDESCLQKNTTQEWIQEGTNNWTSVNSLCDINSCPDKETVFFPIRWTSLSQHIMSRLKQTCLMMV